MLRFRLGPVPITVEASFLFVSVLLMSPAWRGNTDAAANLVWATVVSVSVLVHEMGHAVACLRLRLEPQVVLRYLGGVTLHRRTSRWNQNLMVAAAGPLAGLLLVAVCGGVLAVLRPELELSPLHPLQLLGRLFRASGRTGFEDLFLTFMQLGLIWSTLNLLPIYTLDGSLIVDALVTGVRGRPAPRVVAVISTLVGVPLVIFFVVGHLFIAAVMVGLLTFEGARLAFRGQQGPLPPAPPSPPGGAELADGEAAMARAREALVAEDWALAGAIADGLEAAGGPHRLAVAARIRASLLLLRGDNVRAVVEAGRSFGLSPDFRSAVLAARAALRAGEREVARTWVQRARESGASEGDLRADEELSALV